MVEHTHQDFSNILEGGFTSANGAIAVDDEEPPQQVKDHISGWITDIDAAKEYHSEAFDKIDLCILLGNGIYWPGQTLKDPRYVADVIKRVVKRRVSSLYAKNPTVVARRVERLDFAIWDGKQSSMQQALENPEDINSLLLLQDITQGKQRREMLDKVAKTQELVFAQQLRKQNPKFKKMMKQVVRREEITGVGYVRLDFHRRMEVKPYIQHNITDLASQLSELEASLSQEDHPFDEVTETRKEQIRIQIKSLEEKKFTLVEEGLLFSFPKTKSLIIDPDCYQLDGFLGARWLAEEFFMTAKEIKRVSGKDITKGALFVQDKLGSARNNKSLNSSNIEINRWKRAKAGSKARHYRVYVIFDLDTYSTFMIAEGFDEYLHEPAAPKLLLKRFFPYYSLSFTETENQEGNLYPDPTVWSMRHPAWEFNRAKEALRQHRIASKPLYVSAVGALSKEDKDGIDNHEAHACIELQTLQEGESVEQKFQMVKKVAIDPNVYATEGTLKDIFLVSGSQASDIGTTSGATATESSIAEDSRVSDLASDADDLDDFLSDLFEDAGNVILTEFSIETVKRIAGRGAVWPEFNAQDLVDDIFLEVEAGSSGRPNKAAMVSSLRQLMPFILQMPGANPEFWLRKMSELTLENIRMEDAFLEGVPSIIATNAQAQISTGDPATDPNAQGPQGANTLPGARVKPVRGLRGEGGAAPSNVTGTAVDGNPEASGGILSSLRDLVRGR